MRFDSVYDAVPVIFGSLAVRFDSVYDAVPHFQELFSCSCHFQELGSEV